MRSRFLVLLSAMLFVFSACSIGAGTSIAPSVAPPAAPTATPEATASPTPTPVELTIFAAASLKGALEAAKTAYEAANPGTTLTVSTDASSALATQIVQGAPADVFLSADAKNPRSLADKGLTTGPPVNYATNILTIIVPIGNPANIMTPAGLAKKDVKVIAAGDEVPITKYANQLVDNLAKLPGYPADFVEAYHANIVSKEDNVKAVVAKLELGEGDAAIVYVTDAKASTKVATPTTIPPEANVVATYDGVVIKDSANVDAATAFLTWFAGPEGQAILSGFGFLPPAP